MKKTAKSLVILLFFVFNFYFCVNFGDFFVQQKYAYGFEQTTPFCKDEFIFKFNGKTYKFYSSEFKESQKVSEIQKSVTQNNAPEVVVSALEDMGFDQKEIVNYLVPEVSAMLEKLKKIINYDYTEDKIFVCKNECKIDIKKGKNGRFLNEEKFYQDVFNCLKNNKKIQVKVTSKSFSYGEDKSKIFIEKGYFKTGYQSSSKERKQNIKQALSVFDGMILNEGEVLSFNKATGPRSVENGYSKAKIISNGTFTEGFGGGVCQVSTTLYNACLLAGLEILEVHPHSLPVSYVEPSFDAMVSTGSSDLVVRNNTGGKVIITTSSQNDECKVKIFGVKNKYKIERKSEKIKTIPKEPEIVDLDYKKYGLLELEVGEEKRLSYAKDGFYSKGYLNYYDENENLVFSKQIRENKYNATKGVVVKREK